MKRATITCLVLLFLSSFGYAEFAVLKIEERVSNSDLIVTGRLISVSESQTENLRSSKGILVIEKTLYGDFADSMGQKLKSGDKVEVEWENSQIIACQFGFEENEKQVWFLTVDKEGNIAPLLPGSADSLDNLPEIDGYLKKSKRLRESVRTIRVTTDLQSEPLAKAPIGKEPETKLVEYSLERKLNYQPILVFLVLLGSTSLYHLLYRSRFKIR